MFSSESGNWRRSPNLTLERFGALLSIAAKTGAKHHLKMVEPLQARYLQINYVLAIPEFQPLQRKRTGKKTP
jgi:hypothetical protein